MSARMKMQRYPCTSPLLLLLPLLQLVGQLQAAQIPLQQVGRAGRSHPCSRPCVVGQTMTCRYDFFVENYYSMSKACYGCPWNATDCARPDCIAADGVFRALVVVNRQLPGPSVQLCQGDRVEVNVHNKMHEQSTSVHWHGMLQRGTPYMDGVPFVTQCPVQPHSAFRYSFRADNAGTHFWHSHTGCQRADGAVGFFTVRVPKDLDPHGKLYDADLPEHGVLAWDWTHTPASSKFLAHHHAGDDNKADSVLINGKGAFRLFQGPDKQTAYTPREEFFVKPGLRYRFRLVNAGFLNCPLELSIDNHTLLVIASDGADVRPLRVDSLVSYAGERWDVVVEANQPVANYWMRLHGQLDCGPRRAHQAAVLRYEGADVNEDPVGPAPSYDVFVGTKGLQVNPLNRGSSDPDTISVAQLRSLPPAPRHRVVSPLDGVLDCAPDSDPALKAQADVQLFVSYDFYAVDNPHIHRAGLYGITQVPKSPHRVFTPQLNHISLSLPAFPLLPGRDRLDTTHALCNETSLMQQGRDCTREYCECTHVVRVPLGGVLEIVLVDQGVRYDANHPFHLHGHTFRVVGLERLGTSTTVEDVRRLDAEGRIARNLFDPPAKDTVTVPDGGYTVLRVHADNPGYWLFHCHIEFHVELGMALVVKVGEHEDMPPVPKGFPQCDDWGSNSWLGDTPGDDVYIDKDVVHVDAEVADKVEAGNHIARVLGPHPSTKSQLSPAVTSTSLSTTTLSATSTSKSTTTFSPGSTSAAPLVNNEASDTSTPAITTENDVEESTISTYETTTTAAETSDGSMQGDQPDEFPLTDSTTLEDDEAVGTVPTTPLEVVAHPSSVTFPTRAVPTPTAPVHQVLSEFIMRVTSHRHQASLTQGSAAKEKWVIADPARPELQYNVVLDVPKAAAQEDSRTIVQTNGAPSRISMRTPLWVLVCLALALS